MRTVLVRGKKTAYNETLDNLYNETPVFTDEICFMVGINYGGRPLKHPAN